MRCGSRTTSSTRSALRRGPGATGRSRRRPPWRPSPRSPNTSGWGPWCCATRSATRGSWRSRPRPSTSFPADASTWASAPAGSRPSSTPSACRSARWASGSRPSRRRSRSSRRLFDDPSPFTYEGTVVSFRDAPRLARRGPAADPDAGSAAKADRACSTGRAARGRVEHRVAHRPRTLRPQLDAVRAACEAVGRDPATFRLSVRPVRVTGETDDGGARSVDGRASVPAMRCAMTHGTAGAPTRCRATPRRSWSASAAFEAIGVEQIVLSPWSLPFAVPDPSRWNGSRRPSAWAGEPMAVADAVLDVLR